MASRHWGAGSSVSAVFLMCRRLVGTAVRELLPTYNSSLSCLSSPTSWNASGIVVGQGDKGIGCMSPDGGAPQVVIRVKDGEEPHGPQTPVEGAR